MLTSIYNYFYNLFTYNLTPKDDPSKKVFFKSLPIELEEKIFTYFDFNSTLNFSQLNKSSLIHFKSNNYWKNFLPSSFNISIPNGTGKYYCINYFKFNNQISTLNFTEREKFLFKHTKVLNWCITGKLSYEKLKFKIRSVEEISQNLESPILDSYLKNGQLMEVDIVSIRNYQFEILTHPLIIDWIAQKKIKADEALFHCNWQTLANLNNTTIMNYYNNDQLSEIEVLGCYEYAREAFQHPLIQDGINDEEITPRWVLHHAGINNEHILQYLPR